MYVVFFFFLIALIIAFMTMILVPKCFFVNNYSVFVLSVTDMTFSELHDANPSDPLVLVLQDRHRSHLVDTEQVCVLLNINYYYILLV